VDEFRSLIGKDLESIFKTLHSNLPVSQTCSRFRSLSSETSIETSSYYGAQAFIFSVLEITPNVAYLTSKDESRAKKALEALGFPRLPIFSPTTTLLAKPAPDLFFAAKAFFGKGSQLYFGDTCWDQQAASAASAEFVFCDWGYGSPDTAVPPTTSSNFESALAFASSFAKN
jgi:beta-phosphoglucomutase-like phosphatase (HAD superfamily)